MVFLKSLFQSGNPKQGISQETKPQVPKTKNKDQTKNLQFINNRPKRKIPKFLCSKDPKSSIKLHSTPEKINVCSVIFKNTSVLLQIQSQRFKWSTSKILALHLYKLENSKKKQRTSRARLPGELSNYFEPTDPIRLNLNENADSALRLCKMLQLGEKSKQGKFLCRSLKIRDAYALSILIHVEGHYVV